MLTLPLEPTDDRANPVFEDAASCAQWLGQLQLTNLKLAHSMLLTQLNELNRYPMRDLERLSTLEALRETVGYVQEDYARKLIAKPLPLNDSELMIFVSITQLWQAMVLGYQRCLQSCMSNDSQLASYGALLCQRCLLYSGLEIFEYLRASYEFDSRLWHQLHELYAFAESQELHLVEVGDALNLVQPRSNCRSIYVKTLLACYARPAELTRSQLKLLGRWLALWSNDVTVECSYAASRGDAQPLAVDLAGTCGLQPVKQTSHSDSMRYLAMVPLSKLLRVKMILLQQGQTPQQAGLSEYGSSSDCVRFLSFLHQSWCEERNTRADDERHPVTQHTQLCCKMENIYAHFSGRAFKQPGRNEKLGDTARKQIETFGRILEGAGNNELSEKKFPLEHWHLENESILGAQLVRDDPTGTRLSHNQLIATRSGETGIFILGATIWVKVKFTGELQIGVRYLPGTAEAVSIRATGVNANISDKYVPAFLLPSVAEFNTQTSLIIPRDWFQPGRVVAILNQNDETRNVKMGFSVERGVDYERVSFTPV